MGKISSNAKYRDMHKRVLQNRQFKMCFVCRGQSGGGDVIASHTIPQFVLKNISSSRKYKSAFQFELPGYEPDKIGLKHAGIFNMLCSKCDTELFKTYETKENYSKLEKEQEILREIALKNALKKQYDLLLAVDFLEELEKKADIQETEDYFLSLLMANDNEIQKIWDILRGDKERYRLIYKSVLSYVTPIAAQGEFPYARGLSKKEFGEYCPWMNLAVLPLESETIILLFTREGNHEYDKWISDFLQMEEERKLEIINDMVFYELDDFFIEENCSAEDLEHLKYKGKINLSDYMNQEHVMITNYLSEGKKLR